MKTEFTVAIVHYEGDDFDCLSTLVGPTAKDCCNTLFTEMLESYEDERKFHEENDLIFTGEKPTWDGTDEDWQRLCREQGMAVMFHNHVLTA